MRERNGAEADVEAAVSIPRLEEVADDFRAIAATRNGEGENESS